MLQPAPQLHTFRAKLHEGYANACGTVLREPPTESNGPHEAAPETSSTGCHHHIIAPRTQPKNGPVFYKNEARTASPTGGRWTTRSEG